MFFISRVFRDQRSWLCLLVFRLTVITITASVLSSLLFYGLTFGGMGIIQTITITVSTFLPIYPI